MFELRQFKSYINNDELSFFYIFKYFNNSDVEIVPLLTDETASEISKVHIDLMVDYDKDNNPDINLNSDINLRNYGL